MKKVWPKSTQRQSTRPAMPVEEPAITGGPIGGPIKPSRPSPASKIPGRPVIRGVPGKGRRSF